MIKTKDTEAEKSGKVIYMVQYWNNQDIGEKKEN